MYATHDTRTAESDIRHGITLGWPSVTGVPPDWPPVRCHAQPVASY
jgi:hypothetical protein